MRTIWGAITEISDLGVVAEQCPFCQEVRACLLRSVCRGNYICFVKTADPSHERSALCTTCHKAFPCEHWRYACAMPIRDARGLDVADLLARTNPGLAERLQLHDQVCTLGGDPRFAKAYHHIETLRPGALRAGLLKQLLDWERLNDNEKAALAEQIADRSRAWQFARLLAPGFPDQAGFPIAVLAFLPFGSAFLWLPAVRGWLLGGVVVLAGLAAVFLAGRHLATRRIRHWTRHVLIPEAEETKISLRSFVEVVDDLPSSRLAMMEDLWPVKIHLDTIRGVLSAEGKLDKALP